MGGVLAIVEPPIKAQRAAVRRTNTDYVVPPNHAYSLLAASASSGRPLPQGCDVIERISCSELTLGENISWGSTALIRRCEWKGKEFAVKLLFPEANATTFLNELNHWSAVKHENIITVHAACEQPGSLCFVMDYIKGGTLKQYIRTHSREDWPLLFRIAIDIASAMHKMHQLHRIHRDLNSDNILLNSLNAEGNLPVAVVSDLGDCCIISESMKSNIGIVAYQAPEMMNGGEYTTKVDVYSFGVLLWEMIAREEPFKEETLMTEIVQKIQDGIRPSLPPFCPPAVSELIKNCWQDDPMKRPSFLDVINRLIALAKIWKDLNVDQLLCDVDYYTTDAEKNEKWEDTSFTDLELEPTNKRKPMVRKDNYAEEEQEIISDSAGDRRNRPKSRSLPKVPTTPESYRSKSKRKKQLPIRIPSQEKIVWSSAPRLRDSGGDTTADRLRNLSKPRNNLHQLLTLFNEHESEDVELVLQILRSSLHKETERARSLKAAHETLFKEYKKKVKTRKLLEGQLHDMRKELQRNSLRLAPSLLRQSQYDKLQSNPDTIVEEEQPLKWCEMEYSDIQRPYAPCLYSPVGIWMKGMWKDMDVFLCMMIGKIESELLTKFRKLSTIIQLITNHPNICNMIGIISKTPNFGIVLHVPSQCVDLQALIMKRKLLLKEKILILRSIAMALSHCHENGRAVGWLDPHSVFVHEETLHTSIAHICNLPYFGKLNNQWQKFRWQAPELFSGRNKSSAFADCFSLGLFIFYVIVGKEPYEGDFTYETAQKLTLGWRPAVPDECPGILRDIMIACWKKNPELRPGAESVGRQLHSFLLKLEK